MLSELRYSCRSLAKTPGFTLIALVIVAVGISAATVIFSAINALVLKPLPFPQAGRLVAAYETNLARNVPFFSVSFPDYRDWRARSRSFASLAAMDWRPMNLTGAGGPELVHVRAVTANFFSTFGLRIERGRDFLPEEDAPGAGRVVILSDGY